MYTGNLDGNLSRTDSFGRKNFEFGPGEKGCQRGTGAEKQRWFQHVDHVWHVNTFNAKHHRHRKGVLDIRYVSSWSAING